MGVRQHVDMNEDINGNGSDGRKIVESTELTVIALQEVYQVVLVVPPFGHTSSIRNHERQRWQDRERKRS